MIKLVIFDLDDTIFLNEAVFWEVENGIAKSFGLEPISLEAHRLTWGMQTKDRLARNFPAADTHIFFQTLLNLIPKLAKEGRTDVISGRNEEIFKKLRNNGKKLIVFTSREAQKVRHLQAKTHPLNKWVEKIYHAGNLKYMKPDVRVFEQILKDLKVKPSEAVYIGDLVSDAACAKGAGLHFVAVLENGLQARQDFKPHSVDFFADTFPDIIDYILSH